MRILFIVVVSVLLSVSACSIADRTGSNDAITSFQPAHLKVVDVAGSPRAMGVALGLALKGRALSYVYQTSRAAYEQGLRTNSVGFWLRERAGFPALTGKLARADQSGTMADLEGYGAALGVSTADAFRALIASASGSTSLAIEGRRSQTGGALLLRNVDWTRQGGALYPVVTRYAPDEGQRYMIASWPLMPAPIVGVNEAGVGISLNFFNTGESLSPIGISFAYRESLQRSRTAEEAARIIEAAPLRESPAFVLLGDATGQVIGLECSQQTCVRIHGQGGYLPMANHALSAEMRPLDTYRDSDSLRRYAEMRRIATSRSSWSVQAAARVLGQVSGPRNRSRVANSLVLNSVVVDTRGRRLIHAVDGQPFAGAGGYVSIGFEGEPAEFLPPMPIAANMKRDYDALWQAEQVWKSGDAGQAVVKLGEIGAATDAERLGYFKALAACGAGNQPTWTRSSTEIVRLFALTLKAHCTRDTSVLAQANAYANQLETRDFQSRRLDHARRLLNAPLGEVNWWDFPTLSYM